MGDGHSVAEDIRAYLEQSRLFEKGGDLLQAYDQLVEGLAVYPESNELKHRAVLTLARAGATKQAQREFERLGLGGVRNNEDILALGGRLLKDMSLAAHGHDRRRLAGESAAKYAQAYSLHHGYYPGINTATMTLLAGGGLGENPRRRRAAQSEGRRCRKS